MNEWSIPLHLIGFPSPSLAVAAINSTTKAVFLSLALHCGSGTVQKLNWEDI